MEIVCGRFTGLISGCDRIQGLVCSSNLLFFIISRQYISGTMLCIVKRCSVSEETSEKESTLSNPWRLGQEILLLNVDNMYLFNFGLIEFSFTIFPL